MNKYFEKLEFDNVCELLKIINSNEIYSNAIAIYSTYNSRIKETEKFITDLDLLEVIENRRKPIDRLINSEGNLIDKDAMKALLLEKLLCGDNAFSDCAVNYIELFIDKDGAYIYVPDSSISLKQSGIRNFLYELGAVELKQDNKTYQLNIDKTLTIAESVNRSTLSPKALSILQQIKKIIGEKAELCVMEYERRRLKNNSKLLTMLKHVALTDVSAGYDILSWESISNTSECKPRYIEVKAVPADNLRFYWSSNEIEVAQQYRESYCLYLLPRINEVFLIDKLKIVRNPNIEKLIEDGWSSKIENYSIWR